MADTTIGLLHPGEMGAAVGRCLTGIGQTVLWASAGRGATIAEMEEISATMEADGLPGGFHQAAADIYRRTATATAGTAEPDLDAVLTALIDPA